MHKTFILFISTLFVTLVASLLSSQLIAEVPSIPDDKTVIQFETKLGIVTFAHRKHADLSITECTTCHHKMQPGDTSIKACHDCHQHKSEETSPKTKTAFHTRCTGCHEYTVASGQQSGPLKKKCRLCHIKQPVQ